MILINQGVKYFNAHPNAQPVKFRNRRSWSLFWGVDTWIETPFSNGEAVFFGDDIPIKVESKYLVSLDLLENRYSF